MKEKLKNCAVRLLSCRNPEHLRFIALLFAVLLPAGLLHAQLPVPELNHQLTQLTTPVSAPDFILEDMDGESHSLSLYRGKVVMVNFWATWCPPCRRELPSMEALYQAFKDDDFTVLAINQWESPDHVFAYMGQLEVFPGFPILFDRDSAVSQLYAVKGLPSTVLIDKRGRIVYRAVGGRDFNHPEVRAIIRGLLADDVKGSPVAPTH
jgi:thiol-disulfide isomerase/thioredoxin